MATTLLAVDDSNTMRKVLEITFSGEDYTTVIAATAAEAMNKLASDRPQLALIDAGLDGDGYALCQQIKSAAPGIAVILLTSKHQPYDRTRGGQVGADDFMDKPFDTQQLLDRVKSLSSGRPQVGSRPVSPPVSAPAPMAASTAASSVAARPRAQTLSYGTPTAGARDASAASATPPTADASRLRTPTLTTGTPPSALEQRPVSPLISPPTSPITTQGLAPAAQAALATANGSADSGLASKLASLGLTSDQVHAVLALSREIVEQAVWEVVPTLAETMIREELDRLTAQL